MTIPVSAEVVLDPADPAFAADPYPVYDRVREASPIWRQADDHLWYLTRWDEVHAAFRDRRLASSFLHRYTPEELGVAPGIPVWRDPRWTEFQAFERWDLLTIEPPDHTRLRRLITEAFTPRSIDAMRDPIRARSRRLLDAGREAGSIDLVGSYAQAYSVGIICGMIGIPESDHQTVLGLSDAIVSMYEPAPSETVQERANRAAAEFRHYILDLVADRRRRPHDDLLAALVDARVDGDRLEDDQIASTAMVLLMAGHEAAVNASSNGVAALAAHPDQWRLIRTGAVAPRDAIEELLRWDPPLQWFERFVLEDDVVIAGEAVPKGTRLALMIGSANRDPRRHADPGRLDIARSDTTHLSLGGGIHFCIGAPLARLELETTLTELARSEEELVVLPGTVRRPTFQFRGYEHLVIGLSPAG